MKQVLEYSYEFNDGAAFFYVKVGEELVPVRIEAHILPGWADAGGPLTLVRSKIREKIGHDNFELMKSGGGQNA